MLTEHKPSEPRGSRARVLILGGSFLSTVIPDPHSLINLPLPACRTQSQCGTSPVDQSGSSLQSLYKGREAAPAISHSSALAVSASSSAWQSYRLGWTSSSPPPAQVKARWTQSSFWGGCSLPPQAPRALSPRLVRPPHQSPRLHRPPPPHLSTLTCQPSSSIVSPPPPPHPLPPSSPSNAP